MAAIPSSTFVPARSTLYGLRHNKLTSLGQRQQYPTKHSVFRVQAAKLPPGVTSSPFTFYFYFSVATSNFNLLFICPFFSVAQICVYIETIDGYMEWMQIFYTSNLNDIFSKRNNID